MLAIGREESKQYQNAKQIAVDTRTGREIYVVPRADLPSQKISNPWSLVDIGFLHKLKKRYGLSKSLLRAVQNAYTTQNTHIALPEKSSVSDEAGIETLEQHILDLLKDRFIDRSATLIPFYSPSLDVANSTLILGRSNSGKSWLVFREIPFWTSFQNRPIIVFSPHPRTDRSIMYLRAKLPNAKKMLRVIDLDAVAKARATFTINDIPEGAIVIADDVEGINYKDGEYNLREMLIRLCQTLALRGRHKRIVLFFLAHNVRDRSLAKIRNEVAHIFIMHSHGSKNSYVKFLKQDLGLTTNKLKDIFKDSTGRWIFVSLASPTFVMSQTSINMLD